MSCLYLTGRPCINSFSVVFCFQTAPSIKTLEAHGIQKDVKDIAISNKYIKEVNKFLCGSLLTNLVEGVSLSLGFIWMKTELLLV